MNIPEKISTRIMSIAALSTSVLLLTALFGSALVFWGVDRTSYHTLRMNLAHESYEKHLQLSSHTYQLFKQYGDAMLIGDRDDGLGEAELIKLIRSDITSIRQLIGREIDLVGEEELEELEALAEMERVIGDLIGEFERRVNGGFDENIAPFWTRLSGVLDNDIDVTFNSMMQAALAEEREEVDESRMALSSSMTRVRQLATVLLVSAIAIAAAIGMWYRSQVHRRLWELMRGVGRMRQGQLDVPIASVGPDEIGHVSGLLNEFAADISKQKQVLETRNADLEVAVASRTTELERLLEDARTAERNRRRLLSDVSHELKTPLTIIQGESEVTLRGAKNVEEYRSALERTRDAAVHTRALIDDLLLIARQEEGQLKVRMEATDLVGFFRDVTDLFPTPVELDVRVERASVDVDRLRLRQSVLALLDNAEHYGGSPIVARLSKLDGHFRLSIIDHGPGLHDQEKEQVFERFFRGSNRAGAYREGSGLGLPIVRAIAEAHGGAAGVKDNEKGGSEFYVDIPEREGLRAVS